MTRCSPRWIIRSNGPYIEKMTLIGNARIGIGNVLDNVIIGTAGNDTLDGGSGNDTLIGGRGRC